MTQEFLEHKRIAAAINEILAGESMTEMLFNAIGEDYIFEIYELAQEIAAAPVILPPDERKINSKEDYHETWFRSNLRTMSKNEMITMIETMNNYDDLAAKAKAKADAIREAIKEEMVRQDTEELVAGAYIVRFTSVISNRFDSTTFKRLYADLYKDFTKPVSSRRFSVSC